MEERPVFLQLVHAVHVAQVRYGRAVTIDEIAAALEEINFSITRVTMYKQLKTDFFSCSQSKGKKRNSVKHYKTNYYEKTIQRIA